MAPQSHRGARVLLMLAFAIAAGAILVGFFNTEWVGIRTGLNYTENLFEQFTNEFELQTDEEVSLDALSDLDQTARDLVSEYWPVAGLLYIVLVGVGYGLSALTSLIQAIFNIPFTPYGPIGRFFAIVGVLFTVGLNVVLPLYILQVFEERFLPDPALVSEGFELVYVGVIIGGVASVLQGLGRMFIRVPFEFAASYSGAQAVGRNYRAPGEQQSADSPVAQQEEMTFPPPSGRFNPSETRSPYDVEYERQQRRERQRRQQRQ
ncbi:MAG: hypothetical protein ACOCZH_01315 [Phototrophicaceae bacterium]